MVELLKLAISRPLHALVILACGGVVVLSLRMIEVESAVAVMHVKQELNAEVRDKVSVMNETMIRMDANLINIVSHMGIPRSDNESTK